LTVSLFFYTIGGKGKNQPNFKGFVNDNGKLIKALNTYWKLIISSISSSYHLLIEKGNIMNKQLEEIKPCKKCKGEASLRRTLNNLLWVIKCPCTNESIPTCFPYEAITDWNKQ